MANKQAKAQRWNLALAGGGARGAYQFGVILGLRKEGVEFNAVAGTSVGALNGAIVACDAYDEGEAFWRSLDYSAVYPPRRQALAALGPRFYNPFVLVLLAINLLFVPFGQADPMHGTERHFNVIRALWATLLAAFLTSAVGDVLEIKTSIELIGIFVAVLVLLNVMLQKDTGHSMAQFRIGLICFMAFVGGLFMQPLAVLKYALILAVSAYALFRLRMFAALDSRPLAAKVGAILDKRRVVRPLTVTLARQQAVFDPERGYERKLPMTGPAGVDFSQLETDFAPSMIQRWVPRYFRIEGDPAAPHNVSALIASASLPFGIVEHVKIDGTDYVDGGVSNNLPVLPFLEDEAPILLIHMNAQELGSERILDEARNCLIVSRLAALPRPPKLRGVGSVATPPEYLAVLHDSSLPLAGPIIELFPQQPISSRFPMLDLLRFDKSYTNRLIDLGVADGQAFAQTLLAGQRPVYTQAG